MLDDTDCDTWAHKSVIDNNKSTVAVMPCGLNNIYPKQNEVFNAFRYTDFDNIKVVYRD